MDAIYNIFNKNYLRFTRHIYDIHSMDQDLDDIVRQKDNYIDFITIEYTVSITYNLIVSIPCLFYIIFRYFSIFQCDPISSLWLTAATIVKLIEIIPKSILLHQTKKLSTSFRNDAYLCCRCLMDLTRSNLFHYNKVVGYTLLIIYGIYILFIRKSMDCHRQLQFQSIIHGLIYGFFIRLILSLINYYIHFSFAVNEADRVEEYVNYTLSIPDSLFEKIEMVVLDKDNIEQYITKNDDGEKDVCSICICPFEKGDVIKLMPCNNKHIFHKDCIYKWLKHNKICPTCRKEISKRSFQKIYHFEGK